MSNAIFTTSESSPYDDQPEVRYHFPATYLGSVNETVGDWIIYYEPRRVQGPNSSSGRQAYFAVARVERVEPDVNLPDHFYAYVRDYIALDQPVPFREGIFYYESGLRKIDGSTNKGAFGRSVRIISNAEFVVIAETGFTREFAPWEIQSQVEEPIAESVERRLVTQLVSRKFRDAAFRRHVRSAYANTCAITGLRLINGGGRPEVQAAHIRPVEVDGPDTVRNGIALTSTVHWLFDRGLISIEDSGQVLLSPHGVPDDLAKLFRQDRRIALPAREDLRPHPTYLAWHRKHRFKY